MNKNYISIGGAQHRVEANWNAITSYLSERGKDTLEGLSDISKLPPSELAPLMAACINEGNRLDGNDARVTAQWLGENCGMAQITEFVTVFCRQTSPQIPAEKAKKE
jgi:hypothetical protein